MGRLSDAYEGARAGDGQLDPAVLEAALAALMARGREAHPALAIDECAFAGHLARCAAPVAAASVHAEDLHLAFACLQGVPGALESLQQRYRPQIVRHLRRIHRANASSDEIVQRLWDALIVGGDSGPRLARYSGTGPLESWLGVAAARVALMLRRHEGAETRARKEAAAQSRLVADSPELAAVKKRYRAPFAAAVQAAVALLDQRERTLYHMHLAEGLTLERIAKVYGVHHTTVLRWINAAGEKLRSEVRRRLRDELRLSESDFESIARLLVSQLDLSVSQLLEKSA